MLAKIVGAFAIITVALTLSVRPAEAETIEQSFDFQTGEWNDIDQKSGGITIHRVRVTKGSGGFVSSITGGVNDQNYLEITVELEYSNEGDNKIKSTFSVQFLDADGETIDGFEIDQNFKKNSSRQVAKQSMSSSKYGIGKAARLSVKITL